MIYHRWLAALAFTTLCFLTAWCGYWLTLWLIEQGHFASLSRVIENRWLWLGLLLFFNIWLALWVFSRHYQEVTMRPKDYTARILELLDPEIRKDFVLQQYLTAQDALMNLLETEGVRLPAAERQRVTALWQSIKGLRDQRLEAAGKR